MDVDGRPGLLYVPPISNSMHDVLEVESTSHQPEREKQSLDPAPGMIIEQHRGGEAIGRERSIRACVVAKWSPAPGFAVGCGHVKRVQIARAAPPPSLLFG